MLNSLFEIILEIPNPKLISTNEQYMHPVRKCKDGRYRSYTCKSPSLKELQEFYSSIFKEKISDELIQCIHEFYNADKDKRGLELIIEVGLPQKEIYKHDGSNWIKALEDCLVQRIKLDDSNNLKVSVEKMLLSEDSTYESYLRLKILNKELRKFNEQYIREVNCYE